MSAKPFPKLRISPSRTIDYLLNPDHPKGGPKARWFIKRGFARDDPMLLARALFSHAMTNFPRAAEGQGFVAGELRLVIEGPLTAPDGSGSNVRAVWQSSADMTTLTLLTAFPRIRKA